MAVGQKIIPQKGMDLDNSELYIEEMKARFIKNITFAVNDNEKSSLDEAGNQFVFTPLESNSLYCELDLPEGLNYCTGFFYSKDVKQAYVWVWNSNGNHLIYRIHATTGQCEKVVQNSCLNLQLHPAYMIAEGRCAIKVVYYFNKKTGQTERRIFLLYTDFFNDQRCVSVEDCIATNFFDPNAFPFFQVNDQNCYRCNYLNLGVPTPLDCISITPISRDTDDPDEMNKANKLLGNVWQFRIKHIDVWGRPSEHGVISNMYVPAIGNACIANNQSQPRCLKLKFKAGCPTIDKIYVEFRNWTGNVRGFSTEADWYRADIIEKYDNSQAQDWWERDINPAITYNSVDNTIEYTFCAEKEKVPIDVNETNRGENPLAKRSSGLFPIGKSIALARNIRKFEPMDFAELDKVEFTVTPPSGINCSPDLVDYTIYGVIWNPYHDQEVRIRKDNDRNVFGIADCAANNPFAFDQVFPAGQEGFIGTMRGTKHYAISEQCRYDRQTGNIEFVGLKWPSNLGDAFRYFPIQRWKFKLPPGEYIFQVSSHKSAPADDYMKTSTYVIGRTVLTNLGELVANSLKEIRISGCAGDVEVLTNPIMIYDLTRKGKGCAVGDATSVVAGYMYEDELEKRPIERARVDTNVDSAVTSIETDHNGFYFAATRRRGLRAEIYGYKSCVANQLLARGTRTSDNADSWYKFDLLYAYKGQTAYPSKDRMLIKGKVVDCNDSSLRIPGALVVLTRGGYGITNGNGEYTIVMHDIGVGGIRHETLVFSQQGSCQMVSCTGVCNFCLPTQDLNSTVCSGSDRTIIMADEGVKQIGANKKGPKMGGRYGMCLFLHDWMGRKTFAQALDKHYKDIPTLAQTQLYDYSVLGFDLNGAVFPLWTKHVSFGITENLNFDDWDVWVAERVQYIDNTGKTNNAAPTQIRFYYEGLAEYNKQNNFSTNTNWQFIDDKNNTILGDYVEILANGDGTIFTERKTARVKHDKEGKFFLVDYDTDLAGLTDGVLIQFVRPTDTPKNDFYYELCPTIRVIDGVAQQQTGTFNFFDSYLLSRQIPVPVEVKTTQTDGEIVTSTDVQIKNFPFFFEHHSPSDFWADHAMSKGRVSTKNPWEKEQFKLMEIAVSKSFDENGVENLLHYFSEEDVKTIDVQGMTGIVVCLPEDNTVLVVCETGNVILIYNDSTVEIDENGRAVAISAERRFGRPIRKIGNEFGCQLEEINTIRKRNGIVMFLDITKSALVEHNFEEAADVSPVGFKGWLESKINHVQSNNLDTETNGRKYFVGVIDPKTNKYVLTDTIIEAGVPQTAPGSSNIVVPDTKFINDLLDVDVTAHESLVYDLSLKTLAMFVSYTPEYFGAMESDLYGPQKLAFRKGQAWRHHQLLNPGSTANTFFGTQVQKVIEVVFNMDNTKVKNYLWTEVYCKEVQFYCDRIITESGQLSRLMPLWWDKRDKFWTADFKCALNTPQDDMLVDETTINAILDGDALYGRWLRARYVGKAAEKNKYFELTAIIGFMNGAEKSSTK